MVKAYRDLIEQINKKDVLDKKTMALIYAGIYSTIRDAGALRHYANQTLKAEATKEEIQASALLGFDVGVSSAELNLPIILDLIEHK